MRILSCTVVAMALALVGAGPRPGEAAPQDNSSLEGRWKLTLLVPDEMEFLLFDARRAEGRLEAQVVDALPGPPRPEITKLEAKDDAVTLEVRAFGGACTFAGTRAGAGDAGQAGAALGTFRVQGQLLPARLESTKAETVTLPSGSGPIQQALFEAMRVADPKARIERLRDALDRLAGKPGSHVLGLAILTAAEDAGLPEQEARDVVERLTATARPHGATWAAETWANTLKALAGKKTYASLTLELAQEADRALGESASLEQRATVVGILAATARAAGQEELATAAAERLRRLDERLDAEYRAQVPPFQPEPFAGRAAGQGDRVVLLELFTGAQCPPCVAADVAFDALIRSYRPSELVTLQYHLHIPGPDPLTNPAALARQAYYGAAIRGTPTTLFNGRPEAMLGGGMGQAEAKFHQYREVIDARLDGKKAASIDLNARRQGDEIQITATAQAHPVATAEDQDQAKDDHRSQSSKLRLRLALVEDEIRYVGGNRLRFHHHVVRAMPGGPEGKDLTGGKGQVDVTVNLADVRKELQEYLGNYTKTRSFPNPLPAIALKDLSVVAFVQDDGDKSILHAVAVPVEEEK